MVITSNFILNKLFNQFRRRFIIYVPFPSLVLSNNCSPCRVFASRFTGCTCVAGHARSSSGLSGPHILDPKGSDWTLHSTIHGWLSKTLIIKWSSILLIKFSPFLSLSPFSLGIWGFSVFGIMQQSLTELDDETVRSMSIGAIFTDYVSTSKKKKKLRTSLTLKFEKETSIHKSRVSKNFSHSLGPVCFIRGISEWNPPTLCGNSKFIPHHVSVKSMNFMMGENSKKHKLLALVLWLNWSNPHNLQIPEFQKFFFFSLKLAFGVFQW